MKTYGDNSARLKRARQMLEYCRFSYKAYAQSCQFPLDPFYESWGPGFKMLPSARDRLIAHLHGKLKTNGNAKKFDPIKYILDRTPNPHKGVVYRGGLDTSYILFQPRDLDKRISAAQGFDLKGKALPPATGLRATGNLRCGYFQGRTGMTENHPNSGWTSYLGAVVFDPAKKECVIVFRGSRSGSGERALAQAQFKSKGSPDWVTDMNHLKGIKVDKYGGATIAGGFHYAYESCKSSLLAAYRFAVNAEPKTIYVTGHSLGGAIAQCGYLDITCGEVGSALGIREQQPRKFCFPISSPPVILGRASHQIIGMKADVSHVFHYYCPKDAVHASPLVDFSGAKFGNMFVAAFTHPSTDPFHMGCEISVPCDKAFPDAHEPDEVWKGLSGGKSDPAFWPTFELDVAKDTSIVTKLPGGLGKDLQAAFESSCSMLDTQERAWEWKAVVKDARRRQLLTDDGEELWRKAVALLEASGNGGSSPQSVMKARNAVKNARKVLIEGGYKNAKSHSASSSCYWTMLQYIAVVQVIMDGA